MSKSHIRSFLENVYFPTTGDSSVLIIDALTQYVDKDNIPAGNPEGKKLTLKTTPAGTTGLCQPEDVFFFRPWKEFVRKVKDAALAHTEFIPMYTRDNRLKLQSVVHHQFSSPKFTDLIRYAWYKPGYLKEKPQKFVTPVKYSFSSSIENCMECDSCHFMRCAWCEEFVCFHHFFVDYHYCCDL